MRCKCGNMYGKLVELGIDQLARLNIVLFDLTGSDVRKKGNIPLESAVLSVTG
jgi:hypothetical protein